MLIYDRFMEALLPAVKDVIFYFGPYFFIPLAGYALWVIWMKYIRMHNIMTTEWTLLEVILPREAFKSPKSMEVIFGVFKQTYSGDWWTKFIKGTIRTWFSLELVSMEGRVHFYIRCHNLFKTAVEAAIYGEFPDAVVLRVEDYMKTLKYGKDSDLKVYFWEFGLTKPDPYPIRTYVDLGFDKEGVEDQYISDPIRPVVEFMSSLGKGEYAVLQIMIMFAKKRYRTKKGKMGDWTDEGKDLIDKIIEEKTGSKDKKEPGDSFAVFKLTPVDTETIKAIDRSMSKNGFDTGIRLMYAANKDDFKLDNRLAFKSMFSSYHSTGLNSFKIDKETSQDSVIGGLVGYNDYWVARDAREMFNATRLRSYFYPPYARKPFVLNTEELATIYHFSPGATKGTGVERSDAKSLEPPMDLPM